jgi:hypothetical protein
MEKWKNGKIKNTKERYIFFRHVSKVLRRFRMVSIHDRIFNFYLLGISKHHPSQWIIPNLCLDCGGIFPVIRHCWNVRLFKHPDPPTIGRCFLCTNTHQASYLLHEFFHGWINVLTKLPQKNTDKR